VNVNKGDFMGFDLSTIFGGNLGQMFKDIVGTFKLSPEKKAEFQAIVDANAFALQAKEAEYQTKLLEVQSKEIETASANIRAEASSGDKFTSRARPSFMYMMIVIMGCNYIVFPLIGRPPILFPEPLFWLFGSAILGYTGARSWEKIGLPKGEK
jgi:hypothetical protein